MQPLLLELWLPALISQGKKTQPLGFPLWRWRETRCRGVSSCLQAAAHPITELSSSVLLRQPAMFFIAPWQRV